MPSSQLTTTTTSSSSNVHNTTAINNGNYTNTNINKTTSSMEPCKHSIGVTNTERGTFKATATN